MLSFLTVPWRYEQISRTRLCSTACARLSQLMFVARRPVKEGQHPSAPPQSKSRKILRFSRPHPRFRGSSGLAQT